MRDLIRRFFATIVATAAVTTALLAPFQVLAGNQLYEPMTASVRAALHKAVSDNTAPFLAFSTVGDARTWLDAMSGKLERRIPDRSLREQFLVTVHYEAKRAGLDPQMVLGLIQVGKRVSQIRGINRRRARPDAGDAVLDQSHRR